MNTEQILQVIDAISESSLSEFKYEGDGVKFSMKKTGKHWKQAGKSAAEDMPTVSSDTEDTASVSEREETIQSVNDLSENSIAENRKNGSSENQNIKKEVGNRENGEEEILPGGNTVKSPLVGTFYAAPSEDSDSFVKIGDHVEKGQVLAIIEAMKLMNEIESDFVGTVAEILVQNGEAVEYGQPLFVIR